MVHEDTSADTSDDLCSILSEDMQSSASAPQAVAGTSVPPQQLLSSERAMTRFPGMTYKLLAVSLARDSVFCPQVMQESTCMQWMR